MTRDEREMTAALMAVLLFHKTGTWSAQRQKEWQALTGKEEVTAAVLCDVVRAALPEFSDYEPPVR